MDREARREVHELHRRLDVLLREVEFEARDNYVAALVERKDHLASRIEDLGFLRRHFTQEGRDLASSLNLVERSLKTEVRNPAEMPEILARVKVGGRHNDVLAAVDRRITALESAVRGRGQERGTVDGLLSRVEKLEQGVVNKGAQGQEKTRAQEQKRGQEQSFSMGQ